MNKATSDILNFRVVDGKTIVVINNILFRGKRFVNWDDVESYLKKHIGESYVIADTKDIIYFESDLPDEYAHSEYTSSLKGANAKAKANAAQGLGQMLEIAINGSFTSNIKKKHIIDAANGWYRYESRFALPVYGVINIKKETSTPLSC